MRSPLLTSSRPYSCRPRTSGLNQGSNTVVPMVCRNWLMRLRQPNCFSDAREATKSIGPDKYTRAPCNNPSLRFEEGMDASIGPAVSPLKPSGEPALLLPRENIHVEPAIAEPALPGSHNPAIILQTSSVGGGECEHKIKRKLLSFVHRFRGKPSLAALRADFAGDAEWLDPVASGSGRNLVRIGASAARRGGQRSFVERWDGDLRRRRPDLAPVNAG